MEAGRRPWANGRPRPARAFKPPCGAARSSWWDRMRITAWRQADRLSRPYSLRSAADYVRSTLEVPPAGLRAVVAPFHDQQLEEYRIAFTLKEKGEVTYGVVWPLLGAEDEDSDALKSIESILRECGIADILELEHPFPLEYCDDCGAPLFPSPDGEAVHAEMPESSASVPTHLH